MNEKDLEKLDKSELIKLLLKQNAKPTQKIVIVDDYKPFPKPRNINPVPKPRKSVKQMVQEKFLHHHSLEIITSLFHCQDLKKKNRFRETGSITKNQKTV